MIKKFLKAGVFFVLPVISYGQIWITEIHYNPSGSDTGYEWIEIFNGGDTKVDVTEYKLRENEVNHGIKPDGLESEIDPGEYAVIADKTDKFKSRYANYQGVLFDSAFSLKNSGEKLELINGDERVVFEVTYDGGTGGGDNTHSIGLLGDVWGEVYASPGQVNTETPIVTQAKERDDSSDTNQETTAIQDDSSAQVTQATTPVKNVPATYIEIKNPEYEAKLIKVESGGERTIMAGVEYWFRGEVYGLQGGILDDPVVRWNWGDGSVGAGNPDSHRYLYPGVYTASMSAVSGRYSARDMFTVTVIDPSLVFSEIDLDEQSITLGNESPYNLEISEYQIVVGESKFVFPVDSFVSAHGQMTIISNISGLQIDANSNIELQDKSGHVIVQMSSKDLIENRLRQQVNHENQTLTEVSVEQKSEMAVDLEYKKTDTQIYQSDIESRSVPTHSVVYVSDETTVEENEVLAQGQIIETNTGRAQQASIVGASTDRRYLLDILLFVFTIVLGCGVYIYHRIKQKNDRPIYDVLE